MTYYRHALNATPIISDWESLGPIRYLNPLQHLDDSGLVWLLSRDADLHAPRVVDPREPL